MRYTFMVSTEADDKAMHLEASDQQGELAFIISQVDHGDLTLTTFINDISAAEIERGIAEARKRLH